MEAQKPDEPIEIKADRFRCNRGFGIAGSPDLSGFSVCAGAAQLRDTLCSARIGSCVAVQDSLRAISTIWGQARGRTLPGAAACSADSEAPEFIFQVSSTGQISSPGRCKVDPPLGATGAEWE
jgi:hypothetical protein